MSFFKVHSGIFQALAIPRSIKIADFLEIWSQRVIFEWRRVFCSKLMTDIATSFLDPYWGLWLLSSQVLAQATWHSRLSMKGPDIINIAPAKNYWTDHTVIQDSKFYYLKNFLIILFNLLNLHLRFLFVRSSMLVFFSVSAVALSSAVAFTISAILFMPPWRFRPATRSWVIFWSSRPRIQSYYYNYNAFAICQNLKPILFLKIKVF